MDKLVIVAAYLFIQMNIIWCIYRITKNPTVVDAGWATGLAVGGLIYLYPNWQSSQSLWVSLVLLIWGLRLFGHLFFTRLLRGLVDKRYTELSNNWKISKSLGFYLNFQLQAILILILLIPMIFIRRISADWSFFEYMGIIFSVIGILGETLADLQLRKFKKNFPGEVCNIGLWSYSRHPNYFFDWLTWFGFAVIGFHSILSIFGFISPLCLYLIMTKLTGPLTERMSVEVKGKRYQDYQSQTPMFWPKLKKLRNEVK